MEKNGAAGRAAPTGPPDPELIERPKRRRFTAEFKLAILREVDACARQGEVGALLRRESLYSSHLSTWRKQREEGALSALARKRGPKPADPLGAENAELRRRAERAEAELAKAQGDRGPGKRLSALGRSAQAGERGGGEHRAMIEQTVEELTPLIGIRPACRALGAAPAIYRRRPFPLHRSVSFGARPRGVPPSPGPLTYVVRRR